VQLPWPSLTSLNVTSPANPWHVFRSAKYVACWSVSSLRESTTVTVTPMASVGTVTTSDPPPPPNPNLRSFAHVDVTVTCSVHTSPCLQPGCSRIPANWSLVNTTDHRR
jgi:hypothetical protein